MQKVLMLGWEYPPIINGGLGIACKGIAENLSQNVSLHVVLPQSSKSISKKDFITLNQHLFKDIQKEAHERSYAFVDEIEYVDIDLFPYEKIIEERKISKKVKISELEDLLEHFSEEELKELYNGDLYGDNLVLKVIAYAKFVRNYALLNKVDVIYAHDWMTFLGALEIKKTTGTPFVAHVHSLCYDRTGKQDKGWIYRVEKEALQEASKVIAVSDYTKGIIVEHYDIDANKIEVVHNGLNHLKIKRSEKPFPEKLVLFLGRVTSQKGPEVFLDIAEKVRNKYGNVRFVMAGDGDQLKKLIETGAYRSIGDCFHFTGFLTRDKINQLLEIADVFCMPSVSEPFGLSAIEAAQYGIPAVISKQSGVLEVLDHALVANYWESKRFAEHIVDILDNEELASVLSVQLRQDIKTMSWEKTGKEVLNVLNNVK